MLDEGTSNDYQITTPQKKIVRFFSHPITQLVIGIIVALISYQLALRDICPRYSISQPELIAEQTLDAPNLKLYWNDDEIRNISSIYIAIWNAGRQYLDEESISTTDPISIVIPSGIEVLYSEFIQTSREDLVLKTTIETLDSNNQRILIEIEGDDALEHNDGGVIRILYTGKPETEFSVTGRIKGSRYGFIELKWNLAIGPMIMGTIIGIGMVVVSIFLKDILLKSNFDSENVFLNFIINVGIHIFFLMVAIVLDFILVVNNVFPSLFQPSWLINI